MILDREYIIRCLTDNSRLFADFSIVRIGLFGSYAQNRAHAQSDIDLVFEMQENQILSFKNRIKIEIFLHSLFPQTAIDLVNLKYMNPLVRLEMDKNVIYVPTNANLVRTTVIWDI